MMMNEALNNLAERMKQDYREWFFRGPARDADELAPHQKEMIARYEEGVTFNVGRKYIKVLTENSVWGFIVNTDDDKKFNKGDILMAAGYNAPARNAARGNVFDIEDLRVQWTGANYL